MGVRNFVRNMLDKGLGLWYTYDMITVKQLIELLQRIPPELHDKNVVVITTEYGDSDDSCGSEVARSPCDSVSLRRGKQLDCIELGLDWEDSAFPYFEGKKEIVKLLPKS